MDVRDAAALQAWITEFDAQHPIDLLIANAGVASTLRSTDDWECTARTAEVVDINLYGTLHAVLPAIECMRKRQRGQIAIVSSLAGLRGMAISPAYCVSKAALVAYCDSVRPVLARDHIGISVVMPGFVRTAMSDVFPGSKPFMWSAEKAATYIKTRLSPPPRGNRFSLQFDVRSQVAASVASDRRRRNPWFPVPDPSSEYVKCCPV